MKESSKKDKLKKQKQAKDRQSKSSQKMSKPTTLEIDTLSTTTVRLSNYAKGLSKDDRIWSLSNFLETEQSDMIFVKKLVVKHGDQSIQKLTSMKVHSLNFSRTLFQNQNILLQPVKWEKGNVELQEDKASRKVRFISENL